MHPMINIAVRAARAAGSVQMRYFERAGDVKVTTKARNDFVSEVDRACEQEIIRILQKAYPDHAIVAEESGRHGHAEFEWVVDPLDGTTNYLHGFPQFAVSIACLRRGHLEHGVVYDPLHEEMFTASRGAGARLNDRRMRVSARKGLDGALLGTGFPYRDHRHLEAYLGMFRTLIEANTAGIRRPGSAALDVAYVAAGRLDGFWELGLSPWDFAAGALLVREAGGVVTDVAGRDRFLETGNLVAGGLKVHAAMLRTIRPFLSERLPA
jgi:myo-inositol-1(or 4)-monophosphatase